MKCRVKEHNNFSKCNYCGGQMRILCDGRTYRCRKCGAEKTMELSNKEKEDNKPRFESEGVMI